jgi:lipoprotein NlpD
MGDPVLAAAEGRVIFSGQGPKGYGNLLIVKHDEQLLSVYGHNRALLVKEGEQVRRGQQIAELGNSDSDRPRLRFEIRRDGRPVDPVRFLPPR